MKLNGESNTGSFYDAGKAPVEEAAAEVGPDAVVVDRSAEPRAPAPPPPTVPGLPPELEILPDLTIALDRSYNLNTRRESFRLLRRIGYQDNSPDGFGKIVVPANLETWTTDLTSVPAFLTWLVPKTGAHLPAAILHDGLVLNGDEPISYIAERVVRPDGRKREIQRDEADRIFRDAMATTGTGVIRRWMIWAAVTAATMHHGRQVDWSPIRKWHYRIALWGTIALIMLIGLWCTLDILDSPGIPSVPWMGDALWHELLGGLAGVIVIPLLLGTTWGKFRIAGWILGPLVALIVPAVIPILLVSLLFIAADRLQKWRPRLALALAIALIAVAFGVFAGFWWTA